jgi:Tol biopolymer transport system component
MKKFWVVFFALSLAAGLSGCVSSSGAKYVMTKKVDVETVSNKEGEKITIKESKVVAEQNVIEKSTNVKAVTRITAYDKETDKQPWAFQMSPDGESVIMSMFEPQEGGYFAQLWRTTRNGGAMTKVTSGQYFDLYPSYSPDGNFIYFASNRGDNQTKIWRIKASGAGGLTKITSGSTWDGWPAVASVGDLISYASRNSVGGKEQVWSSTIGGTLPTQITYGSQPVFSPDGKQILYVLFADENGKDSTESSDIWVMDADGSNRTQITTSGNDKVLYVLPSWAPDGKKIVFASNSAKDETGKKNFDIYMMKIDGTEKTQLTTNGSVDDFPVCDPKGKFIYFRSNRGGAWNIWRMELID